jgi:hypothetical protein
MNSIEWLIEEMMSKGYFKESVTLTNIDHLQYKAEEKHKIELGKTWDAALDAGQSRAWNVMRAYEDFDEWYQEKFVSKGSGMSEKPNNHIEPQLPKQEISDEEIKKASYKFWEFKEHTQSACWKMGAKWYREQLKQRQ